MPAALALVAAVASLGAARPAEAGDGAFEASQGGSPRSLLAEAAAAPERSFDVIVQGQSTADVAARVLGLKGGVKRSFVSIDGVAARLSGTALLTLAADETITAITSDLPVGAADFEPAELWPLAVGADELWDDAGATCAASDGECPSPAVAGPKPPAIAVVDSGVEPTALNFGARVVATVNVSSAASGATPDDYGHGTMVASLAAGSAARYPGAAPTADIVSVRVLDERGRGLTSDVIAGVDWILQHRDEYAIRVANFSLHSAKANSFRFDPLDRAVEGLWLAGVVVVTSAGNYEGGGRQQLVYAPANDPFVITVGASDIHGTAATGDDDVAPWSGYGYTADGFAKPEIVAPGRAVVGAVPRTASLALERPDNVVELGYMRLSGTSFAAPVVAGAAAQLLARRPEWTPDEVKGALMVAARPLAVVDELADGVGQLDVAAAAALPRAPNPNRALYAFVAVRKNGLRAFSERHWARAARGDPSWDSASWSDDSWLDAGWSAAVWGRVSWSEGAFPSASWWDADDADEALDDASWSDASWSDVGRFE